MGGTLKSCGRTVAEFGECFWDIFGHGNFLKTFVIVETEG